MGPSGEKIPNEGELKVGIKLESGADRRASFDAADVRKTLLAVSGLCDKEQFVFFDNEGSFICPRNCPEVVQIRALLKKMKSKIKLYRRNGVYVLPMWVKLAQVQPGFHRQT